MAWVRIDDSFADHPKIASAGPLGMALQVAALCYCNRYLTDGFIPMAVAPRLVYFEGLADPLDVIDRLIEAGIWVEVQGGYQIHDYLEYQPSKSEVEETREKRRAAGAKGGRSRGQASGQAKPKQSAKHDAEQIGSKADSESGAKSNPVPVPDPVPNTQTQERIQTDITYASHEAATALDAPAESVSPSVVTPIALINQACEQHIGMMSPKGLDELCSWHTERGMPVELVVEAVRIAGERNKRRPGYASGILRNWYNDGITTLEQARATQNPRGDPSGGESLLERQLREAGVL